MRLVQISLAAASLCIAAPAQADDASDISALEERWGEAFLSGDHDFLRRILAPEFTLVRAENNEILRTPRAQWFATLPNYTFHEFDVTVADVVVAGRTAVATVRGRWSVTYTGRGTRSEHFILSDTWVRRNGRWQVVYRHSTPHPGE